MIKIKCADYFAVESLPDVIHLVNSARMYGIGQQDQGKASLIVDIDRCAGKACMVETVI